MNQLSDQMEIVNKLNHIIDNSKDQFVIDKYTELKRIYMQYQYEIIKWKDKWGN